MTMSQHDQAQSKKDALKLPEDWTVERMVEFVTALVAKVIFSSQDRPDVVEDVIVAVLESFSTYDPSRPFTAWLAGIVEMHRRRYLEARRRWLDRHVSVGDGQELLSAVDAGMELVQVRELVNKSVAEVLGRMDNPMKSRIVTMRIAEINSRD